LKSRLVPFVVLLQPSFGATHPAGKKTGRKDGSGLGLDPAIIGGKRSLKEDGGLSYAEAVCSVASSLAELGDPLGKDCRVDGLPLGKVSPDAK
jgi:hypothetical protein